MNMAHMADQRWKMPYFRWSRYHWFQGYFIWRIFRTNPIVLWELSNAVVTSKRSIRDLKYFEWSLSLIMTFIIPIYCNEKIERCPLSPGMRLYYPNSGQGISPTPHNQQRFLFLDRTRKQLIPMNFKRKSR